jgi:hypothetical protein
MRKAVSTLVSNQSQPPTLLNLLHLSHLTQCVPQGEAVIDPVSAGDCRLNQEESMRSFPEMFVD